MHSFGGAYCWFHTMFLEEWYRIQIGCLVDMVHRLHYQTCTLLLIKIVNLFMHTLFHVIRHPLRRHLPSGMLYQGLIRCFWFCYSTCSLYVFCLCVLPINLHQVRQNIYNDFFLSLMTFSKLNNPYKRLNQYQRFRFLMK